MHHFSTALTLTRKSLQFTAVKKTFYLHLASLCKILESTFALVPLCHFIHNSD